MSPAKPVNGRSRASVRRVLAIPALLLIASIAGLVLGLTGDALPDALSWALLSIPIIVAAIAFSRLSDFGVPMICK